MPIFSKILLLIVVALFIIVIAEVLFEPRLDITHDKVFLWYGIKKRRYIRIL